MHLMVKGQILAKPSQLYSVTPSMTDCQASFAITAGLPTPATCLWYTLPTILNILLKFWLWDRTFMCPLSWLIPLWFFLLFSHHILLLFPQLQLKVVSLVGLSIPGLSGLLLSPLDLQCFTILTPVCFALLFFSGLLLDCKCVISNTLYEIFVGE